LGFVRGDRFLMPSHTNIQPAHSYRNRLRAAVIVALMVIGSATLHTQAAPSSASVTPRMQISIISPQVAGRPTGGVWRPSGLAGGGTISQVSISPTNPSHAIAVGDVSGAFWSADAGGHWHSANSYALTGYQLQLSGVSWDPGRPGAAYAIGGYPGCNGGVFRTADYGHHWQATANHVCGLGDGVSPTISATTGLPSSPRPIGALVAIDDINQSIYAGTFDTGVVRASLNSTLSSVDWRTIALAPGSNAIAHWYIYAVVNDPSDPQTLYVATHDSSLGNAGAGHVWRITDAASQTPSVSELTGSPINAQDLLVLAGNLYAANAQGVWRLPGAKDASPAAAFSQLPAPPTATAIDFWYSLAGYSSGGIDHLWVGGSASGRAPLVQTLASATSTDHFDSTPMWSVWPTSINNVSPFLVGSGRVWWRTLGNFFRYGQPDGPESVMSVAVTSADPNLIMTSDAYGVWRSVDGGVNWQPSADGLGNTVNTTVMTDPNDPKTVLVANMDSVMLESHNHGLTFTPDAPVGANITQGSAIWVDATTRPSTVYLAGAQNSGLGGQIWSRPDAFGSSPGQGWTRLLSATDLALGPAMGKMPTGLIVVRDGQGRRTAITCLNHSGAWYEPIGQGGWTASTSLTGVQQVGLGNCRFAHADGSSVVYLYDTGTGLWRSDDDGVSFMRILPGTQGALQGYIAVDPRAANDVFLSLQSGVYRVTNASTAGSDQAQLRALAPGVIMNPGAVAICDHHLIVAQPPLLTGVQSALFTANLLRLSVWTDISGPAYATNSTLPSAVAGSRDGWLYESEEGQGLIVRKPVAYPNALKKRASVVKVHVIARIGIASVRISVNGKRYHAMKAMRRGNYTARVTFKGVPGESVMNTFKIRVTTAGRQTAVKLKSARIVVSLP
jgi:hypothetical protein